MEKEIAQQALQLKAVALKLRVAEGLLRGSNRLFYPWLSLAVLPVAALIAVEFVAGGVLAGVFTTWRILVVNPKNILPEQMLLFLCALLTAVIFVMLWKRLRTATIRDLANLSGHNLSSVKRPRRVARELAAEFSNAFPDVLPLGPRRRLRVVNSQIKALVGFWRRQYFVGRALLPRSSFLMLILFMFIATPMLLVPALKYFPNSAGNPAAMNRLGSLVDGKFSERSVLVMRSSVPLINGKKCLLQPGTTVFAQNAVKKAELVEVLVPASACGGRNAKLVKLWVSPAGSNIRMQAPHAQLVAVKPKGSAHQATGTHVPQPPVAIEDMASDGLGADCDCFEGEEAPSPASVHVQNAPQQGAFMSPVSGTAGTAGDSSRTDGVRSSR
jgi:hypothetical protein